MTRVSDGIKGHSSGWTTIAYSEELDCVVTGGADGVVRVWSGGAGGSLEQPLSTQGTMGWPLGRYLSSNTMVEGSVICLASSIGAVFCASGGSAVDVHRVLNATCAVRLSEFRKCVTCMRLSKDGTRLVAGGADCRVKLISFDPHKLSQLLRGTAGSGPQGYALLGVRAAETVFRGHTGPVVSVAINCTNDTVASASLDGSVRVWDASTALSLKKIRLFASIASLSDCRLAWNPEMSQVLAIPLLREIIWLNCAGFVTEASFDWSAISSQRITDCAFSPSGFYLCGATADGCIIVWSTTDCSLLMSFRSPRQASISGILWHPKQKHLVLFTDVLGFWQAIEIGVLKLPSLDCTSKAAFLTADTVFDYLSNSCCRRSPYRPKRFYPREIDQNNMDLSNIDIVDVDLDFDLALDLCFQCTRATSMPNITNITLSASNMKQIESNRDPLYDVELQQIFPFVSSPSTSRINIVNIETDVFQGNDAENIEVENQDIEWDQIDITGEEFTFGLLDDTASTDVNNFGFNFQNSVNQQQLNLRTAQFDRFRFCGYPSFQLPPASTATISSDIHGNRGCQPGPSEPNTLPFRTWKHGSFGKETDWRIVKGPDVRLPFDNSREREWFWQRTNKENIPFVGRYSGSTWNKRGAQENSHSSVSLPNQSDYKQCASSSSNCRMGGGMLKESENKFRRKIHVVRKENLAGSRTFVRPVASSLHLKAREHSETTSEFLSQKQGRR